MKKEHKQKWLKALRSGNYEQGFDQLRNGRDEYCCLGVLGDICEGSWKRKLTGTDYVDYVLDTMIVDGGKIKVDDAFELKGEVRHSLGLTTDELSRLMKLNDSEEYTFLYIADWIEENIPVTGSRSSTG